MSRPRSIADQELLSAARKIFLRKGVHAPVSAVARELDVSVAALFFRMKSKEQLLARALLPPFPPPEVKLLQEGPSPDSSPRRQLLQLLIGLCDYLPEALPGFFLLHTAGILPARGMCPETIDITLRKAVATWLRKARARRLLPVTHSLAAADAIMGAMEARFLHAYLLKRAFSRAQNRAFLKDLLAVILPAGLAG